MTLEELQIVLKVNNEQLVKGLQDSIKQLNGFSKQIGKSVLSMRSGFSGLKRFIIGLGIGKALADSINAGLSSIELDNRFQVLFGSMSEEVRAWSEELKKSLGVSAYTTRANVATFYELAVGMGVASESAKEMAKNMTMMGYDVASFKDKDQAQVFNAMQSALVGNTEALRSMGYVVTADMVKQEAYRIGLAQTGDQLNQTQKAMATYSLMAKQMAAANGDLANTINSPSNQLRILKDNLNDLKIELGRAFAPIIQIVIPILNGFITKLIQVVKTVGYFIRALFGDPAAASTDKTSEAINNYVDGLGDITGGYQDATTAAKEYKKSVMGFDELNKLDSQPKDSDSGAGGIEMPDIDFPDVDTSELDKIPENIQRIADKVKEVFGIIKGVVVEGFDFINGVISNFVTFFMAHKESILSIIGGIIIGFAAFKTLTFLSNLPGIISGIAGSLAVLTTPIGIAAAVIGGLGAILVYLLITNEDFRNKMAEIWSGVGKIFSDFYENSIVPLNNSFKEIADAFTKYLVPIFGDLFIQISEILVTILDAIMLFVGFAIQAIQPIIDVLTIILVEAMKMFKQVWDDHLKGAVDAIVDFVQKVVECAKVILNEFVLPIWQWLMETFKPVWEVVIKYVMDVIGAFLSFIGQVADGIFTALGGVLDFLIGIFTGKPQLPHVVVTLHANRAKTVKAKTRLGNNLVNIAA